jgi:hypothetical protein
MEIRCPSCHTLIQKENIHEEEGYAVCDTCEHYFLLSDAPDTNELKKQEAKLEETRSFDEIVKNPPKGVYIQDKAGTITIGTKLRSITAYVTLSIVIIVTGFTGYYILGAFIPAIRDAGSDGNIWAYPFLYIFILIAMPLVFVYCLWLISVLMVLFGKIEVVIGKDSWVFTGIKNTGIKNTFDWKSVRRVYKRTWEPTITSGGRRKTTIRYEIIIEGKNKVNFGRILNGTYRKQFEYILLALQYYHKRRY